MEITENANLRGVLELKVYRRDQLIEHWRDKNMIVTGAKALMASLIAGDSIDAIASIGFGTGSNAAAPSNTGLTNAHWKPLSGHSYPKPGKVKFSFELGTTEANGLAICELGLRTTTNKLFSRKVRGVIEKDSDISLTGSWTITF